jgi:hypothetical protein
MRTSTTPSLTALVRGQGERPGILMMKNLLFLLVNLKEFIHLAVSQIENYFFFYDYRFLHPTFIYL